MFILGLAGFARVGKDTVADAIGWPKVSFAAALKEDIRPLMERHGLDINKREDKETFRPVLVEYGRTVRKVNPTYWIERAREQVMALVKEGKSNIVIPDVRYPNEADWITANGGHVFYLDRQGVTPANDEEEGSLRLLVEQFHPTCLTLTENHPEFTAQEIFWLLTDRGVKL